MHGLELPPRGAVVVARTASARHVDGRFAGLDDEDLLELSALRVVYFRSPSGEYYAHDAEAAVRDPIRTASLFSARFGEAHTTPEELAFVEETAPVVNARRNEVLTSLVGSDLERRCVALRALVRTYPRAFLEDVRPETVVTALVLVEERASEPGILERLRKAAGRFFDDAMFTLVCIALWAQSSYESLTVARLWSCFAQTALSNLNRRVMRAVGLASAKMLLKVVGTLFRTSWLHTMLDESAFACVFLVLTGAARHVLGGFALDTLKEQIVSLTGIGPPKQSSTEPSAEPVEGPLSAEPASGAPSAEPVEGPTAEPSAGAPSAEPSAGPSVGEQLAGFLGTNTVRLLDSSAGAAGVDAFTTCIRAVLGHSPTWLRTPLGVALAVVQLWRIVTDPDMYAKSGDTRWAIEARVESVLETLRASHPTTRAIVDTIPRTLLHYVLAAAIAHHRAEGLVVDTLLRAMSLTRTGFLGALLACILSKQTQQAQTHGPEKKM
jgi:hypothetical protein